MNDKHSINYYFNMTLKYGHAKLKHMFKINSWLPPDLVDKHEERHDEI